MAIKSFKHKGAREIFETGGSRRVGAIYADKLSVLLDAVNAATSADDLKGAYGFHPLKGELAGKFAMKVSGNWRLVFRFEQGDKGDVVEVDFIDYH